MNIAIVNGPNLNLLGTREVDIYGSESFEDYLRNVSEHYPDHEFSYFQSNIEGEIIDYIQELEGETDALVINAAAYSHTSIGIADVLKAVQIPTVEVHISNIYAREAYRHESLTAANCIGVISGLGLNGYELAIKYLIERK